MNRPNVKWKAVQKPSNPGSFVEYEGYDEDGNYYYETANREVVVCVLKDGRKGAGWTAEEAFKEALMRVPKKKKEEARPIPPKVKKLGDNAFIIIIDDRSCLQVYDSIIACKTPDRVILDENYWDYSKTTSKYRNKYLNETTQEARKKIKDGVYKLENLNQ